MAINAQHPQYKKNIEKWNKISKVVKNDEVSDFLLKLNPTDPSPENAARNKAYKERAVFYGLTSQTVQGMVGMMFKDIPSISVPKNMEYVMKNCDGEGNSIYQQSQSVSAEIVSKSRAGLFTTFPMVDGPVSKADIISGKYVAVIRKIEAENILNWSIEQVGSIVRLKMVVIREFKEIVDDYEIKSIEVLRELFLEDGIYKERHWVIVDEKWVVENEFTPTKSNGSKWNEIPFQFVGSENNDSSVDDPNMLSLVELNIAHYRNSADYEDSVWYCGQAQPWMSGVEQDHIDMMKSNNMYIGSRNLIAVPDGGSFGFAAAPPNPAVRQAMIDKVEMMVGIGARMLQPGGVAKTAEQSSGEREISHSILSLCASNVSEAYVKSLMWVGEYMGSISDEIDYMISQEFVRMPRNPAELKEIIVGFIGGTIPVSDYIAFMKKYGIFNSEKADEEYEKEIPIAYVGEGE